MTATIRPPDTNTLRDALERLTSPLEDSSASAGFFRAMQAVQEARQYDDPVLIKHHLAEASESLRAVVNEAVRKSLGRPSQIGELCRRLRDGLTQDDLTGGRADEVGRELEARFDRLIGWLSRIRTEPVQLLLDRGYEVENVARLDQDIQELRSLKEETLSRWPWSAAALPPVDRNMIAESRAALARGEGERIEDLIQRLKGGLGAV
jgi:hypothetical protein